jgi:hypothetical protein
VVLFWPSKSARLTCLGSFDLILRIPYPYDTVTEIKSEECPDLDTVTGHPGLVVQY